MRARGGLKFTKSTFYVGPSMIPPTTDGRQVGTSCRRGTAGSPDRRILCKSIVGQCAHLCNKWRDVRMTQTPSLHRTPLAPGMAVQSTPPAPTHPPHDSMFCFVSTHSNVAFSPGIGHLVYLGSSQDASRRTRRDRPEAAIVFAVTAGRGQAGSVTEARTGRVGGNTYGRYHLTTGCRTRRRCGCSQSRQRQIGNLGQSLDRMGTSRTTSHPCCPVESRAAGAAARRAINLSQRARQNKWQQKEREDGARTLLNVPWNTWCMTLHYRRWSTCQVRTALVAR
jgi:hypothetical protein